MSADDPAPRVPSRSPDPAHSGVPTAVSAFEVQLVATGSEADYSRWREQLSSELARFDGFEKSDWVRPDSATGGWVLRYRFDTGQHLDRWIRSQERVALYREASFFVEDPETHVVAEPVGPHSMEASLLISKTVRPDCQREFRSWQQRVNKAIAGFDGWERSDVFPPVPGVQPDWVIIHRFGDRQSLAAWLASATRSELEAEARPLVESKSVNAVSDGFAGWFVSAGGGRPPRMWKQALVVLLALYPMIGLRTLIFGSRLDDLPNPIEWFVGAMITVAALTFVAMPLLTKYLRWWLRPSSDSLRTTLQGVAVVLAGYCLTIAVTVAVWDWRS